MKGRLKLLFLPLVRGSNLLKEKKISFRIHFQSRIRLLQYGQKDRLKFLSSITNIKIANRTACNRYGYRKALRSLESLSSRTVAVAVGKEHERLRLPYLSFFPIAHADEDQDQPGPSEANTRDEALSAEQEIEDPLIGGESLSQITTRLMLEYKGKAALPPFDYFHKKAHPSLRVKEIDSYRWMSLIPIGDGL